VSDYRVDGVGELDGDPFAATLPDEGKELAALARALKLARGFTLLLACCNQAEHQQRLMTMLQERLPDMQVQRVPVQDPIPHLLRLLRQRLEHPLPEAVLVYGMEAWLRSDQEAERSEFVFNLNAARESFQEEIPCPLVLWLPEHLLAAVVREAPDFCSVRSGLFFFQPIASG